ncbi:hypothetical protein EXE30_04080 [Acinetobacter halotolerans]|uniref:SH3 domain-containing protein n=1 Tax=Acinetobacter halotolerans TaxID=1752076 RepID=A0A4Q6XC53_9GAMM|nr:hypothetical protein [Acinetobacter halotolerans]RZF55982.1 hypothetical protein EXE30_04080 [Acinetobacter halotolerans]
MKRILLALTFIFTSQAFAESDRLEELSKTLSNGLYTHPDNIELPAVSNTSVKLREKNIELSNEEVEQNYGSTAYRAIAKRYVNTASLNVRDKPRGTVVDMLKRGQSVLVYDVSGKWERISKEFETQRWVDSSLLCSFNGCYKVVSNTTSQRPLTYTPSSITYTPKKRVSSSIGGCSCGSGSYCYGPRGGRYCYTSGGNKSYR